MEPLEEQEIVPYLVVVELGLPTLGNIPFLIKMGVICRVKLSYFTVFTIIKGHYYYLLVNF